MEDMKTNKLGIKDSINYLVQGIKIALSKECRSYVIIPILINLVLLSTLGYLSYSYISSLIFSLFEEIPEFFRFIAYILATFISIMIFFAACYIFSTVATIIASPFYGLLADKVEMKLEGTHGDDMTVWQLINDVPRILKRECKKQLFFLPLALLCLIFTFVPVVNLIAPFLWFALTAWMGCLQYCDYAYDNYKIAFNSMQRDLRTNPMATFSFGAVVALTLTVPLLNIIIPPAAVCAGTKYFVEMQKKNYSAFVKKLG